MEWDPPDPVAEPEAWSPIDAPDAPGATPAGRVRPRVANPFFPGDPARVPMNGSANADLPDDPDVSDLTLPVGYGPGDNPFVPQAPDLRIPAPNTMPNSAGQPYRQGVAVRPARGTDAPYVSTGETMVPGQGPVGAFVNQAAQSAIGSVGTLVAGAGDVAARGSMNAKNAVLAQLATMDRIDAGQAVPETDDPLGYGAMDPQQRATFRRSYQVAVDQQQAQPTTQNAAQRGGASIQADARDAFPVDPSQAGRLSTKVAAGVGGMPVLLAAAAAGGPLGGFAVAGLQGYDSAYQAAKAGGADEQQAHDAALPSAMVAGSLMSANAAVLLKGLPMSVQNSVVGGALQYAASSGTMAGGAQVQRMADNAIAQSTYAPDRHLLEGVGDLHDMAADAVTGGLLHGGIHGRAQVRGAMDALSQPVAAPEFRAGAAGMTEAAARANDRDIAADPPGPVRDAPPPAGPDNGNDPGGRRPIPDPPSLGREAMPDAPSGNDNFDQGAPRDIPYRSSPSRTYMPDERPANQNTPDPQAPITGRDFQARAAGVTSRLMADFGLTPEQASGIVGNLGHESGLNAINEIKPLVPGSRGGFGWAQWTGPRRLAFEKWSADRGLDVRDPEANYGFLAHELANTSHGQKALAAVREAATPEDAVRAFYPFESGGDPRAIAAMDSRVKFARQAMGAAPEAGERGETQPVYTNSGTRVDVRPEVVDLSSLITSHDQDGRVNPAFPHSEGMQPRDRASAASQAQVQSIAANLQPERLAISRDAGNGAPIVSPDGVVESGNGRSLALDRVYSDPTLAPQADAYRRFLSGQGYDISGMERPVLIGRRTTPLTDQARSAFARDANERSTLAMSQSEQARADAPRAESALAMWQGDDAGAANNRDFVRAFMARLPAEERGAMTLKDGSLSPEGNRRVQGAVTAAAYGDTIGPALDRALNGNNDGMRAVAGGLSDAAGAWATMRRAARDGSIPPALDATPALGDAVDVMARAKQLGRPVAELVGQADLDRSPLSPEASSLLRLMFSNEAMTKPASRQRVADRLRSYAEEAGKASPDVDMLGMRPPVPGEVMQAVLAREARREPLNGSQILLARRDAQAAHRATTRDSDVLQLTPEAMVARDRLRVGAQAMMRFLGAPPEVGLKLVDRLLKGGADGAYSRGLVTLALDTPPDQLPRKLFHETIHALMDPSLGLLTPGQRMTLLAGADAWLRRGTNRAQIEALYGKGDRNLVREEAVARMGEEAMAAGVMRQSPAVVVYGKLLNTVRRFGGLLRGQGYRTAEDVFHGLLRGDKALAGSREALAAAGPQDPVRGLAAAYGAPLPADQVARFNDNEAGQQRARQSQADPVTADAAAPPAEASTFRTAKGSSYQVHDDGTTSRNKAARADVGHEGDFGPKARSERTVYVDPKAAALLSGAGMTDPGGRGFRLVLQDGKASLLSWNETAGRWGVSPSARDIPFTEKPGVGRAPLEAWKRVSDVPGRDAYAAQHAGNEIVAMGEAAAPTARPSDQRIPDRRNPDAVAAGIEEYGASPDRYLSLRDEKAWRPGYQHEVEGASSVSYTVARDGRSVELNMLRTPIDARGQGNARRAMMELLAQADARGMQVRLTPEPMDNATSKAKLEAFYRSMGFVRNTGPSRDFGTRAAYIREPARDAQLSRREPVASLTGEEIAPPSRPGRLQLVRQWAFQHLRGKAFPSEALGADVTVNKPGIMKPLSHGGDDVLSAFAALPEMIRRGHLVGSEPSRDSADVSTKAWHTLQANVEISGRDVPFSLRIREDKQGRYFYDMNAIRREGEDAAALKSGRLSTEVEHGPGVAAAPGDNVGTPDADGKFSRRPLLSDKQGLEREGQGSMFERSARQAQQARDDAGMVSPRQQKAADDLPLFRDKPVQSELFSLRQNLTTALRDGSEAPRRALTNLVNQALYPMRQGSAEAQRTAFKFANALRGIQYRYGQIDRQLTKQFTPAERSAMGRALDAQSVFESSLRDTPAEGHDAARAAFDAGRTGLSGLSEKQRATVDVLDKLSRQTWQRLVDRKLVTPGAEGLDFYMPRQFVMMDGLGGARRIAREDNLLAGQPRAGERDAQPNQTGGGGMTAMHPLGSNLNDRGPMKREHLTPEESLAAARVKFGDNVALVTDVRSLVDALQRQERAIAGRDLVDAIKRAGIEGGTDLVREGARPERGFFTLDHPSLWTVGPTGATDPQGKPIYGRMPLHIAEEFRGPLDAVLNSKNPDWYKAIMKVKGGSMHLIMFSPFMHLGVEIGRSLPLFHGNPVAMARSMNRASKLKGDRDFMAQAVADGVAPIGSGFGRLEAASIMDDANGVDQKWRITRAIGNAHEAAERGLGKVVGKNVADAVMHPHDRLLWGQVLNLQMGIYNDMRAKFIDKGFPEKSAGVMAAHLANRYAGALPPEHLSRFANMSSNLVLFSRSFTLGNLGVMKDMFNGAPAHIQAALASELSPAQMKSAQGVLRRKAISSFVLDIALFYGLNGIAQTGFRYANNLASGVPNAAQEAWQDYISHMGVPQHSNEPGKNDRIFTGLDEKGRGTYARTPLGKVGEEFLGWMPLVGHPGQMVLNKLNPLLRATWEVTQGKDTLDRKIYNPNPEGVSEQLDKARAIAFHFIKAMGPADFVEQVYNSVTGQPKGDKAVAWARILGPMTGAASISQGVPEGPEAGVQRGVMDRKAYARAQAIPEAKLLVNAGKVDEARALLESRLGNSRDAQMTLRPMLNPVRAQVSLNRRFERSATDEDRARAAAVTGGRGGILSLMP